MSSSFSQMTAKDKIEISIKLFGLIIASFAIAKYFLDRDISWKNKKIDKSIEMIGLYNSSKYTDAKSQIVQFWEANPRLLDSVDVSSSGTFSKLVEISMKNYGNVQKVENSINTINVFFRLASGCIELDYCNKDYLYSYFCDEAMEKSDIYSGFFNFINNKYRSDKAGLEILNFSNSCRNAE